MSGSNTPFIPPMSPYTPGTHASNLPLEGLAGRFPSSPRTAGNTGHIPTNTGHSPNNPSLTVPGGFSHDYIGYPSLPATPSTPGGHSPLPPLAPHSDHPQSGYPGQIRSRPSDSGHPGGTPARPPDNYPGPHPAQHPGTMHWPPYATPYPYPPYGYPSPYPPQMPPIMATPYGHSPYPLPPMQPPAHATPFAPAAPPLPGSGPPPAAPPFGGYPGMNPYPYPPAPYGMPPPPTGPTAFDMSGMQHALPPQPLGRAAEPGIDHISHWAAGPDYGPVLEPFITHILNARVSINPLLSPSRPDSDQPFLKWSMLFPPNMCQRSGDASHVSWSKGRNEPATFPRVTRLTLIPSVSTASLRAAAAGMRDGRTQPAPTVQIPTSYQGEQTPLPFMIDINCSKPEIGVTCGDVIDGISFALYGMSGGTEFNALSDKSDMRKTVAHAYRHNRSRAPGVPGGSLGEGMRKMDWLGLDVYFGGIRAQGGEKTVRRVCGFGNGGTFNNDPDDRLPEDDYPADNPCTFELLCVRRKPETREEAEREAANTERLQAELARDAERRRSRAHSHSPVPEVTVETATDSGTP